MKSIDFLILTSVQNFKLILSNGGTFISEHFISCEATFWFSIKRSVHKSFHLVVFIKKLINFTEELIK